MRRTGKGAGNAGRLDDPARRPDDALLEAFLGRRFSAWKGFVALLAGVPDARAEWRYYTDGKSWLYKVSAKDRTLCWVAARDGIFTATFYFGPKHAPAVESAGIEPGLVAAWKAGDPGAKIRPLTVEVRSKGQLAEVRRLLELKRSLA